MLFFNGTADRDGGIIAIYGCHFFIQVQTGQTGNHRNMNETLLHFLYSMLLFLICFFISCRKFIYQTSCEILTANPSFNETLHFKDKERSQASSITVPFFVSPLTASTLFVDFVRILNQYQTDVNRLISTLTSSYHESVRWEQLVSPSGQQTFLLSSAIESRISQIAQILESDGFMLEKLLRPFDVTWGLPSPYDKESSLSSYETNFSPITPLDVDPMNENYSYSSGVQIIAHITRDWTTLGRPIRKSLYEFCIHQLLMQRNKRMSDASTHFTVLVPGAGLGRLASDLLEFGFHVEANEISTTMASAAFSLLHGIVQGIIHPFAFDFLMNEVLSSDRYQEVSFPDREMVYNIQMDPASSQEGSLSFTLGDFIQTYSSTNRLNTFDAVITCFFIDTATNIYEYILVIRHVLKKNGGIWINVGPLQWHGNSILRPSADELRQLIEALGFTVMLWTVDKEPMNYRHFDDGRVRLTKYEGFNPLRFVVRCTEKRSIDDVDVARVIRDLRSKKK